MADQILTDFILVTKSLILSCIIFGHGFINTSSFCLSSHFCGVTTDLS